MANIHQRRRAQRIAILEEKRLARLGLTPEEVVEKPEAEKAKAKKAKAKKASKPKEEEKSMREKFSEIFKKDK